MGSKPVNRRFRRPKLPSGLPPDFPGHREWSPNPAEAGQPERARPQAMQISETGYLIASPRLIQAFVITDPDPAVVVWRGTVLETICCPPKPPSPHLNGRSIVRSCIQGGKSLRLNRIPRGSASREDPPPGRPWLSHPQRG